MQQLEKYDLKNTILEYVKLNKLPGSIKLESYLTKLMYRLHDFLQGANQINGAVEPCSRRINNPTTEWTSS